MRHCSGDTPDVYEAESEDLARLLRVVADEIDAQDGSWNNVTVHSTQDDDGNPIYRATLYVH